MNTVWNQDGVTISGIVSARIEQSTLIVSGDGNTRTIQFQWEALATQHGWLVTIHRFSGRCGDYQGSTFNLPLEVAVATKRLL